MTPAFTPANESDADTLVELTREFYAAERLQFEDAGRDLLTKWMNSRCGPGAGRPADDTGARASRPAE